MKKDTINLGILELDIVKEQEMKDIFRNDYMQRLKLVMKSKLNGRNKIKATNTLQYSGRSDQVDE